MPRMSSSNQMACELNTQLPVSSKLRTLCSVLPPCRLSFGLLKASVCGLLRTPSALAWTNQQYCPRKLNHGPLHKFAPFSGSLTSFRHVSTHRHTRNSSCLRFPSLTVLSASQDISSIPYTYYDLVSEGTVSSKYLSKPPHRVQFSPTSATI